MRSVTEFTRNLGIDRLRGALVILMVIGDYLGGIQTVPAFLKHAPDLGLTVADTVASIFVFVVGLNFGPSFARRAQDGNAAAYRHFFLRYLALIGIGAVISAGAYIVGQPSDWGVLQAIGVAGLINLLFVRLPTWSRFVIGIAMLWGYQYLLDTSMLDIVVKSVHGGLFGAVSWAALLVLSTAVADVWRKGQFYYVICCVVIIVAASFSAVIVPVSKHRVSLSFILITLALSAVVFLIVDRVSEAVMMRPGILTWWGERALAMYVLHLLVLTMFVTPPIDWWYAQAPGWLIALQIIAILAFMTLIAWWMDRRQSRGQQLSDG